MIRKSLTNNANCFGGGKLIILLIHVHSFENSYMWHFRLKQEAKNMITAKRCLKRDLDNKEKKGYALHLDDSLREEDNLIAKLK